MKPSNRLLHHIAEMRALEWGIARELERLLKQVSDNTTVVDLIEGFRGTSIAHQKTLEARLTAIAANAPPPDAEEADLGSAANRYPASSALQQASASLNRAIVGYAMLRSIALRNRDSILAGKENTGDLAEQHARNYSSAVHRINQALHDVVVWELDREGETCRCTCPSCGLGICLCAQAPRRTLSDIWAELGPISTDTSVAVQLPRADSAAANAGLRAGDVVVAADGQTLDSHFTLQGVVSRHQSGEAIELRVLRESGEEEDVTVVHP